MKAGEEISEEADHVCISFRSDFILIGKPHLRALDRPRLERSECVRAESYKVGPCESFGYLGVIFLLSPFFPSLRTLSRSVLSSHSPGLSLGNVSSRLGLFYYLYLRHSWSSVIDRKSPC